MIHGQNSKKIKVLVINLLKIKKKEERERNHFTTFICCTHPSTAENTRKTRERKKRNPHFKAFLFLYCAHHNSQKQQQQT
jgi:hypothetical protein